MSGFGFTLDGPGLSKFVFSGVADLNKTHDIIVIISVIRFVFIKVWYKLVYKVL